MSNSTGAEAMDNASGNIPPGAAVELPPFGCKRKSSAASGNGDDIEHAGEEEDPMTPEQIRQRRAQLDRQVDPKCKLSAGTQVFSLRDLYHRPRRLGNGGDPNSIDRLLAEDDGSGSDSDASEGAGDDESDSGLELSAAIAAGRPAALDRFFCGAVFPDSGEQCVVNYKSRGGVPMQKHFFEHFKDGDIELAKVAYAKWLLDDEVPCGACVLIVSCYSCDNVCAWLCLLLRMHVAVVGAAFWRLCCAKEAARSRSSEVVGILVVIRILCGRIRCCATDRCWRV